MSEKKQEIDGRFGRTRLLLGGEAMARLSGARVIVFGAGGVGGYVIEALARSGVGAIDVVDNDEVSLSNLNRQVIALETTIGRAKVDVAIERVGEINPWCRCVGYKQFYLPENADAIDLSAYDYVVDCIDTVKAKMELARRCVRLGVRHICSMGAANKLDITRLRIADFSATTMDPLARIMRKKLRKEGIEHFKCAFSDEKPLEPDYSAVESHELKGGRPAPASNAWLPAAMGLLIASEVVLDIAREGLQCER